MLAGLTRVTTNINFVLACDHKTLVIRINKNFFLLKSECMAICVQTKQKFCVSASIRRKKELNIIDSCVGHNHAPKNGDFEAKQLKNSQNWVHGQQIGHVKHKKNLQNL